VIAVFPPWRRRYGLLVAVVTAIGVVSVPIATHSGQHLYDRRSAQFGPGSDVEAGLMERHRQLGHELWPWAVLLLVGVLLVLAVTYAGRRDDQPPSWTRWVGVVAIAATLVGAVLSTVMVARIGHAGSKAVWTSVVNAQQR
jgi:peptidoglycan/LPS O-acetylase OafA/YrhL